MTRHRTRIRLSPAELAEERAKAAAEGTTIADRTRRAIAHAFAHGIDAGERTEILSVHLDDELLLVAKACAKSAGIPTSAWIREALRALPVPVKKIRQKS